MRSSVIHFSCIDQEGIVSRITSIIYNFGANIIDLEQFVDKGKKIFFMRIHLNVSYKSANHSNLFDRLEKESLSLNGCISIFDLQRLENVALLCTKEIEPVYDISKITKVSNKMIHESIDPVTMFYVLTNYNLIKGCNRTIKVYDGKRRYNLILSNPIESDSRYSCTLTHQKISGYKPEKIRENKKYISELNFKLGNDLSYEFNEVSLRVDNTDLIIRKNN